MERGSLAASLMGSKTAVELDWTLRLNIVLDVAHALSYMHHDCFAPIVHRDITSGNVLQSAQAFSCYLSLGVA